MKHCHSCETSMAEAKLHGQTVDKCPRCHGIFFDRGELESILHLVELFQSVKLQEEEIGTVPQEEILRIVRCPADDSPMETRDLGGFFVDVCRECGGIWLDFGELCALKTVENHIRDNLRLYVRLGG